MTIKTKSLEGGFKVKAGGEIGTFSAYGNTFGNVDHAGDKTMKGAFTKCIAGWNAKAEQPQLLGQHGHTQNPIGIITSMKEDDNGLLFEGEFCLETQAGAEAYALVKMGALKRFSIGYQTIKQKANMGVNELHELDVKEISLVTFACNEDSLIQSVKSAVSNGEDPTRLIQKALQEGGFSKRAAQNAMSAAINAKNAEESQKTKAEAFQAKAKEFEAHTHDMKVKGEMSLSDYSRAICKAVEDSVGGKDKYVYVCDIYMSYVIAHVYEEDEDEYREYYMRIPYSVAENMDVMVGSGEKVERHVMWLNESEMAAVKTTMSEDYSEGEKEDDGIIDNKSETEEENDEVLTESESTDEVPNEDEEKSELSLDDIKSLFP